MRASPWVLFFAAVQVVLLRSGVATRWLAWAGLVVALVLLL